MARHITDALLRELARGRVVVVVGSGFTIATTKGQPAAWPALIEDGAEFANQRRVLTDAELANVGGKLADGDNASLIAAADLVEHALKQHKGDFRRWLSESVGQFRVDDPALLNALRELHAPFATTNYDTLLSWEVEAPSVPWSERQLATAVIRRDQPGVLHLHGVYDKPETVVFSASSYQTVRADGFAQFLQEVLATVGTLLFVGCGPGLRDPNLGALLEWVDAQEFAHSHYRLVRTSELSAERVADTIIDIPYGEHRDLAGFVHDLALDVEEIRLGQPCEGRVRARLGVGGTPSVGTGPRPTYLLCDDNWQEYGSVPRELAAESWDRTEHGAARPLEALGLLAQALEHGDQLPSLILIDDYCEFSRGEARSRNALRTMAALTLLFDAHRLEDASRPCCVLFSQMQLDNSTQLTFMELGGHGIALRQEGPEVEAVRRALNAARAGSVAWDAPHLALPLSEAFWRDLFPLLPLLADPTVTEPEIRRRLGLGKREFHARNTDLRGALGLSQHATTASLVSSADEKGVLWLVRAALEGPEGVPREIIGTPAISSIRLRTTRSPEFCARWYPASSDPRRTQGGEWQRRVTANARRGTPTGLEA